MRDVWIYAYHADDGGAYTRSGATHPRLEGIGRTNALGGFRLRTVQPGMAEGIPHIPFALAGPGPRYRTLTLNLARSFGAGSDSVYERPPWMVHLPDPESWAYVHRDADGVFQCRWDALYLQALPTATRPEAFTRLAH